MKAGIKADAQAALKVVASNDWNADAKADVEVAGDAGPPPLARALAAAEALASPLPLPRELWALGFSAWKRPIVRRFLGECELRFAERAAQLPEGVAVVVWAARRQALLPAAMAAARGLRVLTLEDGFLRSVGLGAALTQPLSWVLDSRGSHFDARQPSDLELLLRHGRFSAEDCRQARALRQAITSAGVTKYNVGAAGWQPSAAWQAARGRGGVVLVVGQVEGDAALREGSPRVNTNLGLLKAVRQRCPQAYVAYKPHPDVAAGLREAGADEHGAASHCDEVLADVALPALLSQVDGVHVMTSLAGFEALLRGVAVVTYGQPFYAGWGLTTDLCAPARRRRRLSLDELTAGALLRYPRYALPGSGRRIDAFEAVAYLQQQRQAAGTAAAVASTLRVALVRQALKLRTSPLHPAPPAVQPAP